jgi:hypothetical protein
MIKKKKRTHFVTYSLLRCPPGVVMFFLGVDHFAFRYCSDCYLSMIGRSEECAYTLQKPPCEATVWTTFG